MRSIRDDLSRLIDFLDSLIKILRQRDIMMMEMTCQSHSEISSMSLFLVIAIDGESFLV